MLWLVAGALASAGIAAVDARVALALAGLLLAILVSWVTLVGLGWWQKYSAGYVLLLLLSVLSGSLYLLPLGSVGLWLSLSDAFLVPSLVILVHEYKRRYPMGWAEWIGIVLAAFCILIVLRGVVASQPTRAMAGAKAVAGGLVVFLLAIRARLGERTLVRGLFPTIWLWSIGLLATVLWGVLSTSRTTGLPLDMVVLGKVDYVTRLGRTNYIAALVLLLWPISFYATLAVPWGVRRLFGLLSTSGLVFMLLVLYSRGALIAFSLTLPIVLVGALCVVLSRHRRLTARHLWMSLATISILAVLVAVAWQRTRPFVEQAWSLVTSPSTWGQYSTAQARVDLWQNAWVEFEKNPVFGHGIYNVTSDNPDTGVMRLAHNLALQLAAETGILGLSLYALALTLVAYRLSQIVRGQRQSRVIRALGTGMLVALLVTLAHSQVEANYLTRDFDLLFWGLVGLTFANSRSTGSRDRRATDLGERIAP